MHRFVVFALMLFSLTTPVQASDETRAELQLVSPAFAANGNIPPIYTCEGDDITPPLSWSGVPEGTQSFALIVDDPDAPDPSVPIGTWVHWIVMNIPADVTSLPQQVKILPPGAIEGINDWKETGYRGPCPPVGKHRYMFKLYALDAAYGTKTNPTKPQLEKAMAGHILAQSILIGLFEHVKH